MGIFDDWVTEEFDDVKPPSDDIRNKATDQDLERLKDQLDWEEPTYDSESYQTLNSLNNDVDKSWLDTLWGDRFYSDTDFYSMLGDTALDVGTDIYNTGLDTLDFMTGLPLSPLGAIDMVPGVDKKGIFDALQIKRDAPKLFEGYVADQKTYDFLEELQNDPSVAKDFGSEFARMIHDPETSVDDKAVALREYFVEGTMGTKNEVPALSFKDSFIQDSKNIMNNMGIYESRVSEDNPYKDVADVLRVTGNVVPATFTTVSGLTPWATKLSKYGLAGIASAVNKLPPGMQKVAEQTFPFMSGKGSFWPKRTMVNKNNIGGGDMIQSPKGNVLNRDWNKIMTQPTSIRNFIYGGLGSGAQYGMENVGDMFSANAAEIMSNPKYDSTFGDRDPVIFDSYMQEKLNNYNPPKTKAPGPRNNYQGM